MLRSSTARVVVGVIAAIALLTVLRFKPWQGDGARPGSPGAASPNKSRQELSVGFLPVT